MSDEAVKEPRTGLGWAIRRAVAALALWREADYRRDAYRMFFLGLRGLVGLRAGVALLLLAAAGGFLLRFGVTTPREGYELLARLFGLAALLASGTIYASDQRQGTLELIWLARGSAASLIRYKVLVLIGALVILMIPSIVLVSVFLEGSLPFARTLIFLATNALFIVAVMALAGTLLPHVWAGGLLGSFVLVAGYLAFGDQVSFLNPYLNPVEPSGSLVAGGGAFRQRVDVSRVIWINRSAILVLSAVLLSAASNRMKRLFG